MANLLELARLRLRGRLGALRPRRRRRHGRLQRVGLRAQRRGDLATVLRDARRGRAQRHLRHARAPRPGQGVGRRAPAARRRPAALLRARRSTASPSPASPSRSPRPVCASARRSSTRRRPFWRCAWRRGRPIALSSDAHRPEDVGADYEQALGLLESLGVGELCVFDAPRAASAADRRERERAGEVSALVGIGYDSHRLAGGAATRDRRRRARARAGSGRPLRRRCARARRDRRPARRRRAGRHRRALPRHRRALARRRLDRLLEQVVAGLREQRARGHQRRLHDRDGAAQARPSPRGDPRGAGGRARRRLARASTSRRAPARGSASSVAARASPRSR